MAEPNPHIMSALRQVTLFRSFDETVRLRLAVVAVPRRFANEDVIVTEGETGDAMFVVVHGFAAVTVSDLDEPKRVATLRQGDFFGEMAVVGNSQRSATIVAEGPLLLLELPGPALRALLKEFPKLRDGLVGVGLRRTEENMEKMMGDDEVVFDGDESTDESTDDGESGSDDPGATGDDVDADADPADEG